MPPTKKADSGSRGGKMQIAGHFELEDALTFKGAIAKAGIRQDRALTVQEALWEAVNDWCRKHGMPLPTGLKNGPRAE